MEQNHRHHKSQEGVQFAVAACDETARQLRTWISNGTLTPELWRDQTKPDHRSEWENAVRNIYKFEREAAALRGRLTSPMNE